MEMVYQPERFGNNAGILISGFHVAVDHTKSYPHKVQAITLPDGSPMDMDREYTVTTSAYMATGGNDTEEVASSVEWVEKEDSFYDVLFAYVKTLPQLNIRDYPRLREQGTPENDHAPF